MTHTEPDQSPRDCDLLIVGAGPVGATLACYLGQRQPELQITLLDAAPLPETYTGEAFDPRVVALSPASQALLTELGAWQAISAARACPYRNMHVWDAEGTASVTFTSDDLHLPALGHIVENSVVMKALHQRLESCAGVTSMLGQRVNEVTLSADDGGNARIVLNDGERLSAPLLIAADGASSQVRDMAGIHTREWDYGHTAIVTTVRTSESHQHTAWQRFQASGPLAFLPLQTAEGDSQYSSIVWSIVSAEAERLMQLDDASFCRELGTAFEQRLGPIVSTAKRFSVPLQQRHAVHYWRNGVALVGDAAHSLHPLAGQGVNLGLRDVRVLGEEILRACHRSVPLTDASILKRYERRRQGHNLAAMAAMESFKRLFAAEQPGVRWLRNTGMAFVDRQAWLKKRLAALAIE